MKNEIWIINGIPGVGKSTTAKALAKTFEKSAYIEGDALDSFILSGRVGPGEEPHEEEARQIFLNVRNQCFLARSYKKDGFVPIIDYIVINTERLELYKSYLDGFNLYLVTLNPGVKKALERDAARTEKTVGDVWIHLEEEMKNGLDNKGYG